MLKGPNCWPLICCQVLHFSTEIRDTPQCANEREREREMERDVNEVPWALGNGPLWLQDWTACVRLILLLGGGNCGPKLSAEVWDLVSSPGGNFLWYLVFLCTLLHLFIPHTELSDLYNT